MPTLRYWANSLSKWHVSPETLAVRTASIRQCMEVVRTTSGKGEWWIQNPPKMDVFNVISPRSFFQRGNSPWKMMGMERRFWILLDPFLLGVGLFSVPTLNLQGVIFLGEMYFLMYQSQDGHWKHPLDLMTRGKKRANAGENKEISTVNLNHRKLSKIKKSQDSMNKTCINLGTHYTFSAEETGHMNKRGKICFTFNMFNSQNQKEMEKYPFFHGFFWQP